MENRIATILDNRLGSMKLRGMRDVHNHAELISEWITTLAATTADDYDIAIQHVTSSMRKHLDDLLTQHSSEFIDEAGTSSSALKRRLHDDEDEAAVKQPRFEGK